METSADASFRSEPVLPKQEAEETEDEEEKQERAMKRLKLFSACSEAVFAIARVAEEDIWQGRERLLRRAEASGWWRGWEAAMSLVDTKETEAYHKGFAAGARQGFKAGKASRKGAAKRGDAGGEDSAGGTGGGASAAHLEQTEKQEEERGAAGEGRALPSAASTRCPCAEPWRRQCGHVGVRWVEG